MQKMSLLFAVPWLLIEMEDLCKKGVTLLSFLPRWHCQFWRSPGRRRRGIQDLSFFPLNV